jgi:hypothetical protein
MLLHPPYFPVIWLSHVYECNTTSIRKDRDVHPWIPFTFAPQQVVSAIAFLRFSAQWILSCIWTDLCLQFGSDLLSHEAVTDSSVAKCYVTVHDSFFCIRSIVYSYPSVHVTLRWRKGRSGVKSRRALRKEMLCSSFSSLLSGSKEKSEKSSVKKARLHKILAWNFSNMSRM